MVVIASGHEDGVAVLAMPRLHKIYTNFKFAGKLQVFLKNFHSVRSIGLLARISWGAVC